MRQTCQCQTVRGRLQYVADCQAPDSLEAAIELAPVPKVYPDPAIERQQTRALELLSDPMHRANDGDFIKQLSPEGQAGA